MGCSQDLKATGLIFFFKKGWGLVELRGFLLYLVLNLLGTCVTYSHGVLVSICWKQYFIINKPKRRNLRPESSAF